MRISTPSHGRNSRALVAGPPHRAAFTVPELLAVVAIISIIMSILLPAMNKARNVTRTAICGSNLHQLGLALRGYLSDNLSKFPPKYSGSQFSWWGQSGSFAGYGNTPADSMGPEDRPVNRYLGQGFQYGELVDVAGCPSDQGGRGSSGAMIGSHLVGYGTSYGSNSHVSDTYGGLVDMSGGSPGRGRTMHQIKSPSRMVVTGDNGAYGPQWWTIAQWTTYGNTWYWHDVPLTWNLLFADMHVAFTRTQPQTFSGPDYSFHRDF